MLVKVGEVIQQSDYAIYRLPLPVEACNILLHMF